MNKKITIVVILSVVSMSVSAQTLSGDISPLRKQKEVNVVLDFSGMLVNNQPEELYIASHTKDMYYEDAEAWASEWDGRMRKDAYVLLTRDLNKATAKIGFSVGNYPNAEYSIKVKVINIKTSTSVRPIPLIETEVYFAKKGETTPFATMEIKAGSKASKWIIGTINPNSALGKKYYFCALIPNA